MSRTLVTQITTAQRLGSLVKTARDIMRKDKGLNGDLDRLPMLTWIMFLKFLDDQEQARETAAQLEGIPFRPAIEPPYRWRDWAANEGGITGDQLIAFVNQEEVIRPDGTKGAGLFQYLRNLQGYNAGDRRDVIATVFKGVNNRMINGYLLRDVINRVNDLHFASSEELHTLGSLYESLLQEMRDTAGDSGEFYTPRPVVRFIVQVVNPRLGETVLDPASGTGGFLVEAYTHLEQQCKTVEDYQTLQTASIFGGEAKPMPYMLAQMNLLLHGLEAPKIDSGNSLRYKLGEIGDRDRVDVILTNPPFGGEEEPGIQNNFPADKQTDETALLFLQLIMRKLRRHPKPGRAGVVVPNGTLFGDGVAARIKEELLQEFNLHTIVRLPKGVFEPYADIPTNILFFDRSGPTREVWFYEQPLPEGQRNYSKTKPLKFAEFADCLAWWDHREENEHAWKIPAEQILQNGCNLDLKNPRGKQSLDHMPPEQLVDSIGKKGAYIQKLLEEIKSAHWEDGLADYQAHRIGNICSIVKGIYPTLKTEPGEYPMVVTAAYRRSASSYQLEGPAVCVPLISSTGHGDAALHRVHYQEGKFALANLLAALLPKDEQQCSAKYLYHLLMAKKDEYLVPLMVGTANVSLKEADIAGVEVPLPPIEEQNRIVAYLDNLKSRIDMLKQLQGEMDAELDALMLSVFNQTFKG